MGDPIWNRLRHLWMRAEAPKPATDLGQLPFPPVDAGEATVALNLQQRLGHCRGCGDRLGVVYVQRGLPGSRHTVVQPVPCPMCWKEAHG